MSERIALVYHWSAAEIDALDIERFHFFAVAAEQRLKER